MSERVIEEEKKSKIKEKEYRCTGKLRWAVGMVKINSVFLCSCTMGSHNNTSNFRIFGRHVFL